MADELSASFKKTPEVEQIVRRQCADLPWPQIIAVWDVCRHDLLFETELTACPEI